MKKFFSFLAVALVAMTCVIAQSSSEAPVDSSTQVITIEDKYAAFHPKAKTVTLTAEYTPLTGEVRFYYKCLQGSYDKGDAMNTAQAYFEDFAKENKYKHMTYINDTESSRKDEKMKLIYTTYYEYVRFTK